MNAAQVAAEWARVFTLGKARGKIAELFEGDASRAQRMTRRACGMLYDFSKTALTEESFAALIDLAEAADVAAARDCCQKAKPLAQGAHERHALLGHRAEDGASPAERLAVPQLLGHKPSEFTRQLRHQRRWRLRPGEIDTAAA